MFFLKKYVKYLIQYSIYIILISSFIFIIFIGGEEVFIYSKKNENSARLAAIKLFHCIAKEQNYPEGDFVGPNNVEDGENVYAFEWFRRDTPNATITIVVSYLPYDLDFTVSEALPYGGGVKPALPFYCE